MTSLLVEGETPEVTHEFAECLPQRLHRVYTRVRRTDAPANAGLLLVGREFRPPARGPRLSLCPGHQNEFCYPISKARFEPDHALGWIGEIRYTAVGVVLEPVKITSAEPRIFPPAYSLKSTRNTFPTAWPCKRPQQPFLLVRREPEVDPRVRDHASKLLAIALRTVEERRSFRKIQGKAEMLGKLSSVETGNYY